LPPFPLEIPFSVEKSGCPGPRSLPAVLLISQGVLQSLGMARRAYVLENSRIVMEGKGSDLLPGPKVKEAYLGI